MFIGGGKAKSAQSRLNGNGKNRNHNDRTTGSGGNTKAKAKKPSSSPSLLEIGGVPVHFPFQPYKCQEAYMEQVIRALHHSENALLESPTGTGKTLCLLCSTLAWQMEHQQQQQTQNSTINVASSASSQPSDSSQPAGEQQSQPTNTLRKAPTILYASRTHSQLIQVVQELKNTQYRPKHAVLGSREQMCVHPKVHTAKATSSDINHNCNKLNKERKCRFRNNLDTFVNVGNIGTDKDAKDSSTSSSSGNGQMIQPQQPIMDMEELVTMGKKRSVCPFYLTRGQIADAEIIFVPYNYLFDKDARTSSLADVQWENSILIFDEAHNLESFASESASFDLSGVDIAGSMNEIMRAIGYLQAMPDLADASNSNSGGGGGSVKMENLVRLKSIFLQLEHYLEEEVPDSGGSFSGEYIFQIFQRGANINYNNHKVFLSFVRQVSDLILETRGDMGGSSRSSAVSSGTPKLDHFCQCVKRVFATSTEGQSLAKARSYRVHISQKATRRGGNGGGGGGFMGSSNSNMPGRTLSYWCFAPSLAMQELAGLQVRSILVTSGTLSPLPSYSLELGLSFPHTLENAHIIGEDQISVQVIQNGVSGKKLSSSYDNRDNIDYIIELGNTIISLSKVIPGGVLIFFPSYSVMENCIERWGGPMSSRSRNQNFGNNNKKNFFQPKPRQKGGTSKTAKFVFAQQPAGSNASPWSRLLSVKAVVLEPKSSSDLKDAITEFEKNLSLPKSSGCILMGVCRGKISEGIDFADEKCRAVMITGIPFAPHLDPKVKLKREYLDGIRATMSTKSNEDGGFGVKKAKLNDSPITLSGAEWYSQQAHRAVNQAVGRVIRHRSDYGSIILLDCRFAENRNQIGLSKWVRPHLQTQQRVGPVIGSLVKFYRNAKMKVEANARVSLIKSLPKGMSIPLQYEDDDQSEVNKINVEENMTKIAFIKRSATGDPDDKDSNANVGSDLINGDQTDGYVAPNQVIKRVELNNLLTQDIDLPEFENIGKKDSDTKPSAAGLAAVYQSARQQDNSSNRQDILEHKIQSNGKSMSKVSAYKNSNISDMISSAWSGVDVKATKKSQTAQPMIRNRTRSREKTRTISGRNEQKENNDVSKSPKPSHDQAKLFFELAKESLSTSDFANVRKLLVSMKTSGDKKDSLTYLKHARALVQLLLAYDICTTEGSAQSVESDKNNGQRLCDLLYNLLPIYYQRKIYKLICQLRFDKSSFKQKCLEVLTTEETDKIKSGLPSLLIDQDKCVKKQTSKNINRSMNLSKESYLSRIQCFINILMENENHTALLSLLYPLIPPRYQISVKTIVSELRAEKSIKQIKKSERAFEGEKVTKAHLFRKGKIEYIRPSTEEDANEERLPEEISAMKKAYSQIREKQAAASLELQKTLKKSRTAYEEQHVLSGAKRPATNSNATAKTTDSTNATTPRPSKRVKEIINGGKKTTKAATTSTPTPKKASQSDLIDSILQQAQAERYKKATPKVVRMNRRLKSNLPKNMTCNICNSKATTPCMAECGHVACIECWKQWLGRSLTCPTCRAPTQLKALTKIAYEGTKGSAGPPTLSQICADDDLEII